MKRMRSFSPNPTIKVIGNHFITGTFRYIYILWLDIDSRFQSG